MTAIDIATEALDRLHTTAASHDRVMILEVMGRNTGWIALQCGLAGSADVILIPEIPFSFESVAQKVLARDKAGSRFTNIVVAEGAKEVGKSEMYTDTQELRLGGVGEYVRKRIEELTGKESRCVVLGHLQRGGSPNAFDRMLGTNFGACAVRALVSGETGKMVALQAGTIVTVPLSEACANIKTVAIDGQLVRPARDIGIRSPHRRKQRPSIRNVDAPAGPVPGSVQNYMEAVKKKLQDELAGLNRAAFKLPKDIQHAREFGDLRRMPNTRRPRNARLWSRPASAAAAAVDRGDSIDLSKIPTDRIAYGSGSYSTTSKERKGHL